MAGEPEMGIGDSLSPSECRKAKPGLVFSMMQNTAHTLQHDYGSTFKGKTTNQANKSDWESYLQGKNFKLCQGEGQTDWRKGTLLRFVAKDKATVLPITNFLGLENLTLTILEEGGTEVGDWTNVQYRYNPSAPSPWIDPNTFPYFGGYTKWEILRDPATGFGSGTYAPEDGGDSFSFRFASTGARVVLFTGGFAGNFPTGVPSTDSWSDAGFGYNVTILSGSLRAPLFPSSLRVAMTYSFRVS